LTATPKFNDSHFKVKREANKKGFEEFEKDEHGDYLLPHAVWSQEQVNSVKITHL
jgi:hypothetical protein